MTVFKVQQYLERSNDWSPIATVKPDYRYRLTKVGRWWNPLKRLAGVALNFVPAEKQAYCEAVRLAKKMRRTLGGPSMRVLRESFWSGVEVKDVLWQDGKRVLKLTTILRRKP